MDESEIELAKQLLLSKIEKTDSCWLWTGYVTTRGYGYIGFLKRRWLAHRLFYTAFKGPIPDGLMVCHSCDVPACVNLDHLWLGSQGENVMDCLRKGRHLASRYGHYVDGVRTHCRIGHELSGDNLGLVLKGKGKYVHKRCNACRRDQYRVKRAHLRSGSDGAMDSATDF